MSDVSMLVEHDKDLVVPLLHANLFTTATILSKSLSEDEQLDRVCQSLEMFSLFDSTHCFGRYSNESILYTINRYISVPKKIKYTQRFIKINTHHEMGNLNESALQDKASFFKDVQSQSIKLPYFHMDVFHRSQVFTHSLCQRGIVDKTLYINSKDPLIIGLF